MKKIIKDKKKLFIIFAIISLFILCLSLINKEMQNDTFYDIKVGESIFKNGIDFKDHFSFIPDLKYTYPHWLFDVGAYKIYNSFGFKGLLIGEFITIFIISLTLFFTTRKLTKNDSISFVVSIFMLSFMSKFITVRTQIISYLILLLMLYIIELSREKKNKRYILYMIILSILLANIHCATYPVAIIIFLPYLVSDLISFLRSKRKKKTSESKIIEFEECKNTKFILCEFISVIICGFFSLTGGAYTYIYLIMKGNSMSQIQEHLPSTMLNNPFIFLFMALFLLIILSKNMKIKIKDLFLIGGFTFLTLLSIRSFALFLLLTTYSFTRLLSNMESNYLKHIKVDTIFYKPLFMLCALIYIIIITVPSICEKYNMQYIPKEDYPVDMISYIKSNLDYKNIRLYNHFDHGSYLILNDIKVFIDSRCDLYLDEFNKGINIFNDDLDIDMEFDSISKKYNFTHYLVRNESHLKRILDLKDDIKLIKQDGNFSLYESTSTNV